MPEGDTVFKIAGYLAERLTGRRIVSGMGRMPETLSLSGRRIGSVVAQGKHLLIELDDGSLLRSHLGLWGAWHRYAPDEPWQKPRRQASILLETDEGVYVCFNASQVELLSQRGVRRRILDSVLGPDLLDADADVDQGRIIARARQLLAEETPVLDCLLDQRVACGVGNVYKSEVLFLETCHPETPLGGITDDRLTRLYRRAAGLLSRNTGGGPRITRWEDDGAGRLWVYGRRGRPCLRCGDTVRSAKTGRDRRSTYWCPTCQPVGYS